MTGTGTTGADQDLNSHSRYGKVAGRNKLELWGMQHINKYLLSYTQSILGLFVTHLCHLDILAGGH